LREASPEEVLVVVNPLRRIPSALSESEAIKENEKTKGGTVKVKNEVKKKGAQGDIGGGLAWFGGGSMILELPTARRKKKKEEEKNIQERKKIIKQVKKKVEVKKAKRKSETPMHQRNRKSKRIQ
jgi:hypothetical protein